MNLEQWDELFSKTQSEIHNLYKKNRTDYNSDDNPMAPFERAEKLGIRPSTGALLRLGDKFNLVENYVKNGSYTSHNESIRETLLDIAAYTTLTILLMDQENLDE